MRNGVKIYDCDTRLCPTVETIIPFLDPELREQAPQWGENVIGELGLFTDEAESARGLKLCQPCLSCRTIPMPVKTELTSREAKLVELGKSDTTSHCRDQT